MMPKKLSFFYLLLIVWTLPVLLFGHEYRLAVCTIFKDNAEYFKEWIEFHKLVGVDHFYLYNNSSTDNFLEILEPYIQQGIVTLIDWPNRDVHTWNQERKRGKRITWVETTQETAFNHCGQLALGKAEWVAVIDTDEFLVPDAFSTIPAFLRAHKNEVAILVYWRVYGTSNVYDIPPDRLMIDLLDKRFPDKYKQHRKGKIIFRPENIVKFDWAGHHCICQNNASIYLAKPSDIRINHYVNRTIKFLLEQKKRDKENMENIKFSEEEWEKKINEGNDIEDRIMDRFIPALMEVMGFA